MGPGYYVARVMVAPSSTKLKVESRCFDPVRDDAIAHEGYALSRCEQWRDFVQKEQPDHELVVIHILPKKEA